MTAVREIYTNFNANNHVNPLIEKVKLLGFEDVQRITDAALPFLRLYQPTAILSSVVLGGIKSYQIITKLPSLYEQKNWTQFAKEISDLAFTISTIALSILLPTVGVLLSQTVNIVMQANRLRIAIQNGDLATALESSAQIALSLVYTASVITAAPEVLVISLVAQAAFELYQSIGEFKKGRILEGIAKLAMSCIRTSQAVPTAMELHRNYFGKKITQVDLDRILEQMRIEAELQNTLLNDGDISSNVVHRGLDGSNLDYYFLDQFYSNDLRNLSFENKYMSAITFNKLKFTNCKFDDASFKECQFKETSFAKCSFLNTLAIDSTFKNCSIKDSLLNEAAFYNCKLFNFNFSNCDFTKACFNESEMHKVSFVNSTLVQTNFQGAQVIANTIKNCDLTDTLFLDTKSRFKIEGGIPHHFTRPVVAITWNFENPQGYAKLALNVLESEGSIPLKFDCKPRDINGYSLDYEVTARLLEITRSGNNFELSRGDEIISRSKSNSLIARIDAKSKTIIKYSDGVVLPGGVDIEPELYGHTRAASTWTESDYRHSIVELTMLRQAYRAKIPTMGICRGSQMVNVYFGGALNQNVPDHFSERHNLKVNLEAPLHIQEMTRQIIGDGVVGVSMHHQASLEIGKGLNVAIKNHDGIVESLMSDDGLIVANQFHPEMYHRFKDVYTEPEYLNNGKYFTRLIDQAKGRTRAFAGAGV